jgi:hypothetical protein
VRENEEDRKHLRRQRFLFAGYSKHIGVRDTRMAAMATPTATPTKPAITLPLRCVHKAKIPSGSPSKWVIRIGGKSEKSTDDGLIHQSDCQSPIMGLLFDP